MKKSKKYQKKVIIFKNLKIIEYNKQYNMQKMNFIKIKLNIKILIK